MRWWVGDGVDLASPALAIQLRRAGEVFLPTLDFCLFVKACVGSNPVAYPVSEIEERALGLTGSLPSIAATRVPFFVNFTTSSGHFEVAF